MGVELSKHKNIIRRIERMLQLVHEHQLTCGTNTCMDSIRYLSKLEELRNLQQQVTETANLLHALRLMLHNKSHEAYLQLKADDRIIRKCEQAG
jgi:hypothetical protein